MHWLLEPHIKIAIYRRHWTWKSITSNQCQRFFPLNGWKNANLLGGKKWRKIWYCISCDAFQWTQMKLVIGCRCDHVRCQLHSLAQSIQLCRCMHMAFFRRDNHTWHFSSATCRWRPRTTRPRTESGKIVIERFRFYARFNYVRCTSNRQSNCAFVSKVARDFAAAQILQFPFDSTKQYCT